MYSVGPTLDISNWRVHRVEHLESWKGAGAVNYFISPEVAFNPTTVKCKDLIEEEKSVNQHTSYDVVQMIKLSVRDWMSGLRARVPLSGSSQSIVRRQIGVFPTEAAIGATKPCF